MLPGSPSASFARLGSSRPRSSPPVAPTALPARACPTQARPGFITPVQAPAPSARRARTLAQRPPPAPFVLTVPQDPSKLLTQPRNAMIARWARSRRTRVQPRARAATRASTPRRLVSRRALTAARARRPSVATRTLFATTAKRASTPERPESRPALAAALAIHRHPARPSAPPVLLAR